MPNALNAAEEYLKRNLKKAEYITAVSIIPNVILFHGICRQRKNALNAVRIWSKRAKIPSDFSAQTKNADIRKKKRQMMKNNSLFDKKIVVMAAV